MATNNTPEKLQNHCRHKSTLRHYPPYGVVCTEDNDEALIYVYNDFESLCRIEVFRFQIPKTLTAIRKYGKVRRIEVFLL